MPRWVWTEAQLAVDVGVDLHVLTQWLEEEGRNRLHVRRVQGHFWSLTRVGYALLELRARQHVRTVVDVTDYA